MRRGAIVMLVLVGVVAAAVVTAIAIYVPWLPDQASKERERMDFVFWFTTAICIGIFSVVGAVSVYAGIKFRVAPDDDTDGPPIHGHTGLEIVWTAVPAVLVTAIAIVSAVALARNDRAQAGQAPLTVLVRGQQFAWSFTYPEAGGRVPDDVEGRQSLCLQPEGKALVSSTLRLPLRRSTRLLLCAREVIHSFWVPEFGQKQDAVPGIETKLIVTPTKTGTFRVICTELCGLGHALMRTSAVVMRPRAFDAWLKRRGKAVSGGGAASGQAVFTEQGCGSCHTFAAAKTTGTQGPDLGNLPQYAQRAGKPLDEFVRESIVDPQAYTEKGFTKGLMPPFALPKEQLDALVRFLVGSSSKGGS